MPEPQTHISTMVENTDSLSLTIKQVGTDTQHVPVQTQGREEKPDNTSKVYIDLHGILYLLERDSDETYDEEPDGIKRINDGDDIWETVLQLNRMLTLPSTSPDYKQPTILLKQIHKGEIKNVLGLEILEEEREILLTCVLIISLCCGEAAMGSQWQLIAYRLIPVLPINYIKFFLQKMEMHLDNIDANILEALVEKFKADEKFVDMLFQIFARHDKLKNESNPREILSILTSTDDKAENFGDPPDPNKSLPEKARHVILNEMLANKYPDLNQKQRAEIIAVIMDKKNGDKINQYLSTGIELSPEYVIAINEHLKIMSIREITTQRKGSKLIYKRIAMN